MGNLGILHCSDLHIGRMPVGVTNYMDEPLSLRNAHDLKLCGGLRLASELAWQLGELEPSEDPHVICSGDLTAKGLEAEYVLAHSLLRSHWRVRRTPASPTGLSVPEPAAGTDGRLAVVPGNHDQWHGTGWPLCPGYDPNLKPLHFRPTPWRKIWASGDGETVLELYGLDSNAGLTPAPNPGALGEVSDREMDHLHQRLYETAQTPPFPNASCRVRAIVLHHSVCLPVGVTASLSYPSVRRILVLCEEFKVHALFTGHTHEFAAYNLPTMPLGTWRTREFRSASTTQGPELRKPRPGLWIHRIGLKNGSPWWTSWKCVWDGVARFAPLDPASPDYSEPIL